MEEDKCDVEAMFSYFAAGMWVPTKPKPIKKTTAIPSSKKRNLWATREVVQDCKLSMSLVAKKKIEFMVMMLPSELPLPELIWTSLGSCWNLFGL